MRFRDVARGGIRIVMSRNRETYSINQRMLFDENYGLAATQNLKNKDIPEGGAKGTILPAYVFFASFLMCLIGVLTLSIVWVPLLVFVSRNTSM